MLLNLPHVLCMKTNEQVIIYVNSTFQISGLQITFVILESAIKIPRRSPCCFVLLHCKLYSTFFCLHELGILMPCKGSDPATRHGSAWGERRYSSYSFLTSALDGGGWSASRPGRALPPGKGPPVPIVGQEAGWAPESVWTQRLEEKSSASVGD
jgi:hypothetical protein